MRKLLQNVIRIYQVALSPLLGNNRRFHPTCSQYASDALQQHGTLRGSMMALRRICRCHPWNPGGYDPVPPAPGESAGKLS